MRVMITVLFYVSLVVIFVVLYTHNSEADSEGV